MIVYIEEALDSSEDEGECDENSHVHGRLGKPAETSEQLVSVASAAETLQNNIILQHLY